MIDQRDGNHMLHAPEGLNKGRWNESAHSHVTTLTQARLALAGSDERQAAPSFEQIEAERRNANLLIRDFLGIDQRISRANEAHRKQETENLLQMGVDAGIQIDAEATKQPSEHETRSRGELLHFFEKLLQFSPEALGISELGKQELAYFRQILSDTSVTPSLVEVLEAYFRQIGEDVQTLSVQDNKPLDPARRGVEVTNWPAGKLDLADNRYVAAAAKAFWAVVLFLMFGVRPAYAATPPPEKPTPAAVALADTGKTGGIEGGGDTESTSTSTARITVKAANIRPSAGTTGTPLGTAGQGAEFPVIGEDETGKWIQIQYGTDNEEAWVSAGLVEVFITPESGPAAETVANASGTSEAASLQSTETSKGSLASTEADHSVDELGQPLTESQVEQEFGSTPLAFFNLGNIDQINQFTKFEILRPEEIAYFKSETGDLHALAGGMVFRFNTQPLTGPFGIEEGAGDNEVPINTPPNQQDVLQSWMVRMDALSVAGTENNPALNFYIDVRVNPDIEGREPNAGLWVLGSASDAIPAIVPRGEREHPGFLQPIYSLEAVTVGDPRVLEELSDREIKVIAGATLYADSVNWWKNAGLLAPKGTPIDTSSRMKLFAEAIGRYSRSITEFRVDISRWVPRGYHEEESPSNRIDNYFKFDPKTGVLTVFVVRADFNPTSLGNAISRLLGAALVEINKWELEQGIASEPIDTSTWLDDGGPLLLDYSYLLGRVDAQIVGSDGLPTDALVPPFWIRHTPRQLN